MEQTGALKEDRLHLGKTVAGLVLTSAEDKEWLTERFKPTIDDFLKEDADIVEEFAKERDSIIESFFGDSDSIFAQSWVTHDTFMIGYAKAFAKAFEESFTNGFNQESIGSIEPEALKQRELARRLEALRYLLPYCTNLRFPELVSLALEQAQRLDWPEQLQAMLDKLLVADTNREARYALTVRDITIGSRMREEIINEGLEEGEKQGLGKALCQIVEIRFPILLTQTRQVIEQQTSAEQIRILFNKLCQANTIEEAQAALLPNG